MADFCVCNPDCPKRPIKGGVYAHGHRPKPVLKLCKCGQCTEMVVGEWAHGHYARAYNPSSTDAVRAKRRISSKRRADAGELTGFAGWNRGLSKESDSRVAAYGEKNSANLQADPMRLKKRAQDCKKQWAEGRITPNPKGPESSRWKGGTSPLHAWCRAALYDKWSKPIMIRDGFECQRCHDRIGGNLCVHHDQERFAPILHNIVNGRQIPDLTVEEKMQIVADVVRCHLENNVSGITLCRPCHNRIHEIDPDID